MVGIAKPLLERFNRKWMAEPNTGCFLWTCHTNARGYGTISARKDDRPHGHAYDVTNTKRSRAGRACRTCHNDRQRARRAAEHQRHQGVTA